MPYPNKVFPDPAVIELANACMDGKPDRITALLHQGANVRAVLVEAGIRLDLKANTWSGAKPDAPHDTALERYCRREGGKRGANPLPETAAGWRELEAALARRGAARKCRVRCEPALAGDRRHLAEPLRFEPPTGLQAADDSNACGSGYGIPRPVSTYCFRLLPMKNDQPCSQAVRHGDSR